MFPVLPADKLPSTKLMLVLLLPVALSVKTMLPEASSTAVEPSAAALSNAVLIAVRRSPTVLAVVLSNVKVPAADEPSALVPTMFITSPSERSILVIDRSFINVAPVEGAPVKVSVPRFPVQTASLGSELAFRLPRKFTAVVDLGGDTFPKEMVRSSTVGVGVTIPCSSARRP